ncbi:O-antigen/teichoic acid export membrane protein [Mucilaginibacter sp. SG538B]|uniref:lipopolysaccharide biosynthesis protein n=1 Tax=Mucilaginibacter sp. SG538B TaxID=2587021 RepID=UPI00159D3C28|nr:oligosaccharide flippase family protein [Mucilaginibacter sp. SG538B]NVM63202.1 O-antigen/teichoic acid export membrane protein [Mucilaginibacter sp. SG538B]
MSLFKKLINKHTLSLATNAVLPVLGMVILSLLARRLSKPAFGNYVFFQIVFTLADTFRTGFLQTSVIKFYSGSTSERMKNISGSAWYLGFMVTCVFAVVNLLIYFIYTNPDADIEITLKWFSIIYLCTLPSAVSLWTLQAEERFDKMFTLQLMNQGGFLALVVGVAVAGKSNFEITIYCYFTANLLSSVICIITGWAKVKTIAHKNWATIKQMAHFGKYSVGTSISSYLLRSSDTFIVKPMFSPDLLAVYYIPQRLMEIFEIPLRAFISTALPVMSAAVQRGDQKYVTYIMKKYAGMLTIALTPIAVICFVAADLIIGLLFGAKYQHSDAGNIFRIFMCYVMLLPIDRFFGITLDIINKPHLNMIKVFLMLTVNIIGDFTGILIFHNLYAVAVASIFTFATGAIFGYWALKKHLQFKISDIFVLGYIELKELIGVVMGKIKGKRLTE